MPDVLEPRRNDEAPFVADGLAAGAYDENGVDLTLIRMFLRLTPAERLDEASAFANGIERLRALQSPENR
ncbi:MAG: hypothetical protein KJ062_22780 [Thermoanaerobaculia bacterium]|nr:hypothetical protein [Thermoanaerobaculia bacterium]